MNERLNQLGQAARRLNEGSDQLNTLIASIDKALARLMIGMDYVHPRPLQEAMALSRDGKRVIELSFLGYLRVQGEYHLVIKVVKILESKVALASETPGTVMPLLQAPRARAGVCYTRRRCPAGSSSPPPCRTPTARPTSGTCSSSSRPTSTCARASSPATT